MSWFKKKSLVIEEAPSSGVTMWHVGAQANVEVIGPIILVRHKGKEMMTAEKYLSPAREVS